MRLLNLSVSQLLWVFIATNLLNKLKPNRLFLRWLASCGLKCYQVPIDDELRKLQYSQKREKNDSKKNQHHKKEARSSEHNESPAQSKNEFKIRCSDLVKLNLSKRNVTLNFLDSAPLSDELEWVVDFASMSLISFILTQVLFYFSPRSNEYNFSLVWVFLVILQCLIILAQLTTIYIRAKLAVGERSICLVSAFIFLLLALTVLTTGDSQLELKVNESLQLLKNGVPPTQFVDKDALLDADEVDIPPPTNDTFSPLVMASIKFFIALMCSFVGVMLTFPGFRFGQMHESIMVSVVTSTFQKILYNINLVFPFVIVCLWIPNISRNLLTKQDIVPIDDQEFEFIRGCFLIAFNLLRFSLVKRYLGAFLESAVETKLAQIRRKGGFTSNRAIQISVASMNNFVNVVCVQYILPTVICLFTSIMYISLTYNNETSTDDSAKRFATLRYLFGSDQKALVETVEELIFSIQRLIASDLTRNILGFVTWWTHFAWSCTTLVGFGYHKYFIQ